MIDRTPRGKTYCGVSEFDELHLRPVRTTERVGITRDGWKVRQIITVCDFGRVDRTVADPDAMIEQPERDLDEAGQVIPTPREAAQQLRASVSRDTILTYLREHGLSTQRDLATALNYSRHALGLHLHAGKGTDYQCVGLHPSLWGIAGVQYPRYDSLPTYAQKFYDAIKEHGPMTVRQLCDVTGVSQGSATGRIGDFDDVFVQVGHATVQSGRKHAREHVVAVWGLVDDGD